MLTSLEAARELERRRYKRWSSVLDTLTTLRECIASNLEQLTMIVSTQEAI